MRIIYSQFINDVNKCHLYGHENDCNARYCELCGQPTFLNDILSTWQTERQRYIRSLVRVEHRKKTSLIYDFPEIEAQQYFIL